jgi:hypothetical protein
MVAAVFRPIGDGAAADATEAPPIAFCSGCGIVDGGDGGGGVGIAGA